MKSDKELMVLLKTDGEAAFAEIYNRYWDKLYYVAHRHLKDAETSEEIVQDVFLLLWRKRQTLNIQSLPVYLAAMVRYAVYRWLGKEKQLRRYEETSRLNPCEYTSFDTDIENKLLLQIVTELSNQLPEKCRLVFHYNKLQDRPLAEVAEKLNISQKTAEAHLTKALKLIRSNLGNAFHLLF